MNTTATTKPTADNPKTAQQVVKDYMVDANQPMLSPQKQAILVRLISEALARQKKL